MLSRPAGSVLCAAHSGQSILRASLFLEATSLLQAACAGRLEATAGLLGWYARVVMMHHCFCILLFFLCCVKPVAPA